MSDSFSFGGNGFNAGVGMFQTLIGGITSAFGAFEGGQAQKEMYDYQAGIALFNAKVAQQNSEYAIQVGEQQAMQAGLRGAQQLGQIKAAQSASGLDIRSGSPALVQASQREVTGFDVAAIRSNAAKTAYNYQVQGIQFGAQAQLDTLAGKNAAAAGDIGAMSSIIGTASSLSSEWMKGQSLGLWGAPSPSPSPSQSLGGSDVPLGQGGIGHM